MVFGDYHTHTTYSHGKDSVLDNAMVAKEKGIKELAITDHGFGHMAFSLKRKKLPNLRKDIDDAISKTGVKVFLGVEANLTTFNGDIDVKPEDYNYLEILVVGFHNFVKAPILQWIRFVFGNVLSNFFNWSSKKRIEKNTEAYVKAVHKHPIDIISHLNYVCKVNCEQVARACAETNTFIEINSKRIHFSKKDIEGMLKTDVKFVVDSDAHSKERVGDVSLSMQVIERYGIPLDRVVNLNNTIPLKDKKVNVK